MNIRFQIEINKPVVEVWEKFVDPDFLKQWQPGLVNIETISGVPGESGSKAKLIYKKGFKHTEVTETINSKEDFKEFVATYEQDDVIDEHKIIFEEIGEISTRLSIESTFKFNNVLYSLFSPLMKLFMKGQISKEMQKFKSVVEST